MKSAWIGCFILGMGALTGLVPTASDAAPVKVAVVTGGHGFAEAPFLQMFKSFSDVEFVHVPLKDESEIFEDISAWPYDAIVLYNMTQQISEKRRQNFLALLDKGVGVVALHHSIAAFSDWPECWKIIGARYYLKDVEENGVKHPQCTWGEGVDMNIHIANVDHPVTKGIQDFTVNDEFYKGYTLEPDNQILLTTDNPKSQREIGWVRTHGKAKICYLQTGHGEHAYADPNYRRLVLQAIHWVAGK